MAPARKVQSGRCSERSGLFCGGVRPLRVGESAVGARAARGGAGPAARPPNGVSVVWSLCRRFAVRDQRGFDFECLQSCNCSPYVNLSIPSFKMNGLARGPGPCVSRLQNCNSSQQSSTLSSRFSLSTSSQLSTRHKNNNLKKYCTGRNQIGKLGSKNLVCVLKGVESFVSKLKSNNIELILNDEVLRIVGPLQAAALPFSSAWSQ